MSTENKSTSTCMTIGETMNKINDIMEGFQYMLVDDKIQVHCWQKFMCTPIREISSSYRMERLSFPVRNASTLDVIYYSEDGNMVAEVAFMFIMKKVYNMFDEMRGHCSYVCSSYMASLEQEAGRGLLYKDCAHIGVWFKTIDSMNVCMSFYFKMNEDEEKLLNQMLLSTGVFDARKLDCSKTLEEQFIMVPEKDDFRLREVTEQFDAHVMCIIGKWSPRQATNFNIQ